jgi:hypothetical protein
LFNFIDKLIGVKGAKLHAKTHYLLRSITAGAFFVLGDEAHRTAREKKSTLNGKSTKFPKKL